MKLVSAMLPPMLNFAGAKAIRMWATKTSTAPEIIHREPCPTLSTNSPKSGANTTVKNGIIETIHPALSAGMSKRGMRIDVANFLNEIIQQ